jgi:hypothetical protein
MVWVEVCIPSSYAQIMTKKNKDLFYKLDIQIHPWPAAYRDAGRPHSVSTLLLAILSNL